MNPPGGPNANVKEAAYTVTKMAGSAAKGLSTLKQIRGLLENPDSSASKAAVDKVAKQFNMSPTAARAKAVELLWRPVIRQLDGDSAIQKEDAIFYNERTPQVGDITGIDIVTQLEDNLLNTLGIEERRLNAAGMDGRATVNSLLDATPPESRSGVPKGFK
jgi:hypothetical protein